MIKKIFLFLSLGLLFALPLLAQNASTPEGQKSIEHRNRFYIGNPIKHFSAKSTSLTIAGQSFSNASPAVYDDIAYVGTDSGNIYSVTSTEIKKLCKLENGGAIEGAVALTKDNVYAGFANNLFAAFSRSDGSLLWKYETKGAVSKTPLVHEEMVYFSAAGFVYCLNAETGKFKWRFNALTNASAPAYENDVIFIGNDRQRLYAINAKQGMDAGKELWHYDGAGGTPMINGPDVYALTLAGEVASVDITTGHPVWHSITESVPGTSEVACVNNTLVFNNGKRVFGADSRAGERFKWSKPVANPLAGAPIIIGNVAYIACLDGKIYALDFETGNQLDNFELGTAIESSPAFLNNKIIYPAGDKIFLIGSE
jgi:outer membrane protein assembly factor BamB